MLTLNADSACDVCAEEYGPFNLPQSIACGHVLCPVCADTIIKKSPPRAQPTCPFCRESFHPADIRPIRIDFSSGSGGGSGTGVNIELQNAMEQMALNDDETVLYDVRKGRSPNGSARPSRATSRERSSAASPTPNNPNGKNIFTAIDEDRAHDPAYHRDRAAELERKVAKVATKRTSPEEIHALHRELTEWISTAKHLPGVADTKEFSAIHLSNLLLRAIVANHSSHAEALKVARGAESHLRACLQDGDLIREKLDSDLRKTKQALAQKSQENAIIKAELVKRGGAAPDILNFAPGGPGTPGAVTPTRRQSMSAPTSPEGYFSFSSASTSIPLGRNYPGSNPTSGNNSPCSSGRTTPTAGLALSGGMQPLTLPTAAGAPSANNNTNNGVRSSASAAAAALPAPRATAPSPARYSHSRSASMIQRSATTAPLPLHRSQTPAASSTSSSSAAAAGAQHRERRSMTPAPISHRSASVAPASSHPHSHSQAQAQSPARAETIKRSMTPGLARSATAVGGKDGSSPTSASTTNNNNGVNGGMGNGSSAGVASISGGVSGSSTTSTTNNNNGVPPLPALSLGLSSGMGLGVSSPLARPPVPPKPRTLSQSQGPGQQHQHSQHSPPRQLRHSLQGVRGVVDDRDGYAAGVEKEFSAGMGAGKKGGVGAGMGAGGGGGDEKKKQHQRWLPSAFLGMSRPATSHAIRSEM